MSILDPMIKPTHPPPFPPTTPAGNTIYFFSAPHSDP